MGWGVGRVDRKVGEGRVERRASGGCGRLE